eukprot:TRINITY_DN682_c0_g1_i3.p4 TRINITY_DN682_c0_g1~~TRINITY_DN682_c0_g1_i3.p4  ORF type:complete len:109 (+),score=26.61 TRINITY_DN682_c0_g1_i3:2-328(+)
MLIIVKNVIQLLLVELVLLLIMLMQESVLKDVQNKKIVQCTKGCGKGFCDIPSTKCIDCLVDNCAKCDSATTCGTCAASYYVDAGKCTKGCVYQRMCKIRRLCRKRIL